MQARQRLVGTGDRVVFVPMLPSKNNPVFVNGSGVAASGLTTSIATIKGEEIN